MLPHAPYWIYRFPTGHYLLKLLITKCGRRPIKTDYGQHNVAILDHLQRLSSVLPPILALSSRVLSAACKRYYDVTAEA
ncbi:hypothetical protein U1Q18_026088 [Sarracenia purpurea var. burkii]